jgi:hypothetical protein
MKLAFAEAVLVLEEYEYMESLRDDALADAETAFAAAGGEPGLFLIAQNPGPRPRTLRREESDA